jgi:hypothetical protein
MKVSCALFHWRVKGLENYFGFILSSPGYTGCTTEASEETDGASDMIYTLVLSDDYYPPDEEKLTQLTSAMLAFADE